MAYNGIIGLNVPRTLNAQVVDYEKGQTLIMCSDGIKSKWDTNRYAPIQRYDASILSASIPIPVSVVRTSIDFAASSLRVSITI